MPRIIDYPELASLADGDVIPVWDNSTGTVRKFDLSAIDPTSQISLLQSELDAAEAEIDTLQSQVSSLQSQIDAIDVGPITPLFTSSNQSITSSFIHNRAIIVNSTSTRTVTFFNSIPAGLMGVIVRYGTGIVRLQGSGVTIRASAGGSTPEIATGYKAASFIARSSTEVIVFGDLE